MFPVPANHSNVYAALLNFFTASLRDENLWLRSGIGCCSPGASMRWGHRAACQKGVYGGQEGMQVKFPFIIIVNAMM